MDDILVDAWMVELAGRTAQALETHSTDGMLSYVAERDHMDPVCRRVGSQLADVSEPIPDIGRGAKPKYADFPKLGGVDIVVDWSDRRAAVELKCGSDKWALLACAWDAVKLPYMLAQGEFGKAFLLAGAPSSLWARPIAGTDFFTDREWVAPDVRLTFKKGFCKWEKDGFRPVRVPMAFETRYLGTFPFVVAGSSWELQLARVESAADSWFDWKSLLADGLCNGVV